MSITQDLEESLTIDGSEISTKVAHLFASCKQVVIQNCLSCNAQPFLGELIKEHQMLVWVLKRNKIWHA
jgi:hypothetical protein